MKKLKGRIKQIYINTIPIFLIIFCLFKPLEIHSCENESKHFSKSSISDEDKLVEIDKFITKQMKRGKIPGMAVVIVKKGKTIYKKGFGFANIKARYPVTANTLFELGATSKAFTALGILSLMDKKLIDMEDRVDKYIPWFKMKFKGREEGIKIKQLLRETSGIPFNTIADIPASIDNDALEKAVRILVKKELGHKPGEKFIFASMNYDVLGLIIQEASGVSFEHYMKSNVLIPLGLKNTYLSRREAPGQDMAFGYKIYFKKPRKYDAPFYKGNTPAGYFITNAENMSKWLRIQIDAETSNFPKSLIKKSHQAAPVSYGYPYAFGWFVSQGELIFQAGKNPNFSSFIIANVKEKTGVAVLANINSDFVEVTGRGILATCMGYPFNDEVEDFNTYFDDAACVIFYVTIPLFLIAFGRITIFIYKILKGKRKFAWKGKKTVFGFTISSILMIVTGYGLYILPSLLGYNLPWHFVRVWIPGSFTLAVGSAFITAALLSLTYLIWAFSSITGRKMESKQ